MLLSSSSKCSCIRHIGCFFCQAAQQQLDDNDSDSGNYNANSMEFPNCNDNSTATRTQQHALVQLYRVTPLRCAPTRRSRETESRVTKMSHRHTSAAQFPGLLNFMNTKTQF
jgi:hypothetical protein